MWWLKFIGGGHFWVPTSNSFLYEGSTYIGFGSLEYRFWTPQASFLDPLPPEILICGPSHFSFGTSHFVIFGVELASLLGHGFSKFKNVSEKYFIEK